MSLETALRSRLKADPTISAITTNIEWTARPQATEYPAIVLQVIFDDRPQDLEAFTEFRFTTVQIDCFADSRSEVMAMREAVIAELAEPKLVSGVKFGRAMLDSITDRGINTDTRFIHRDTIDVRVWHNG